MFAEELMQSFTEKTGIMLLIASKEGVLKEFNVESDFPEVLGAMLATVFGAAETVITTLGFGSEPEISMKAEENQIIILPSGEDIMAAFIPSGNKIDYEDLEELADVISVEID